MRGQIVGMNANKCKQRNSTAKVKVAQAENKSREGKGEKLRGDALAERFSPLYVRTYSTTCRRPTVLLLASTATRELAS